jgi:hypothetical protein
MSVTTKTADDAEILDLGDMDQERWNEHAIEMGWSDGLPLVMPTEPAVARFVAMARGDNEPFGPISPRQLVPTLKSLAANAVMAGCKPEYAQMMLINGPLRRDLQINCSSNCFGQGWRANASIGRALQLILLNIGGAKPADMDRSTQGSPAKYSFCFGENEEESPWEPYHVRKGFAASDSVVTTMAAEPPHNINDHSSTSGEGLVTTIAGTACQVGSNNVYLHGPSFFVLGPEHAQTLQRDGWTPAKLQEALYERSRIHVSRISKENQQRWEEMDRRPVNDHYHLMGSPDDAHIVVAGGPGKHSAFIPSFGNTAAPSVRVAQGRP